MNLTKQDGENIKKGIKISSLADIEKVSLEQAFELVIGTLKESQAKLKMAEDRILEADSIIKFAYDNEEMNVVEYINKVQRRAFDYLLKNGYQAPQ